MAMQNAAQAVMTRAKLNRQVEIPIHKRLKQKVYSVGPRLTHTHKYTYLPIATRPISA